MTGIVACGPDTARRRASMRLRQPGPPVRMTGRRRRGPKFVRQPSCPLARGVYTPYSCSYRVVLLRAVSSNPPPPPRLLPVILLTSGQSLPCGSSRLGDMGMCMDVSHMSHRSATVTTRLARATDATPAVPGNRYCGGNSRSGLWGTPLIRISKYSMGVPCGPLPMVATGWPARTLSPSRTPMVWVCP